MTRKFLSLLMILAVQINCSAPKQAYQTTPSLPISAEIPSVVVSGQKYLFIIQTSPDVICNAGIAFWNTDNKWVFDDLLPIQSNELGVCEWQWELPDNAKSGIAEFKAFVKKEEQSTDLIPKTFCIEVCP